MSLGEPAERISTPCKHSDRDMRLGKYLGFIDLRPNPKAAPLAMGFLVPPRRLRRDLNAFISAGEYGPIVGAHGFQCTIYSMQERDTGGADCAQACVMMALASLSDRGAVVKGPYELTYLAKGGQPTVKFGPECIGTAGAINPTASFTVGGGLKPDEMVELFHGCGTSACHVALPESDVAARLAERLLIAYLENRCPAILFLDTEKWWKVTDQKRQNPKAHGPLVPHAVVAVGFVRRWAGSDGLLSSLIVHDPGYRPYGKFDLNSCFSSLKTYDDSRMHIVFVADERIRRHASQCVDHLFRSQAKECWEEYFERTKQRDYRIHLVQYADIVATFFPDKLAECRITGEYEGRYESAKRKLQEGIPKIRRSLYWCIAGYDQSMNLEVLWLYDSRTKHADLPYWSGFLDVSGAGEFTVPPPADITINATTPPEITVGDACSEDLETDAGANDCGERIHTKTAPAPPLDVAAITTCSDMPLSDMFRTFSLAVGLKVFDVCLLRDVDIREIELSHGQLAPPSNSRPDSRCLAEIIENDENYGPIRDWLLSKCATVKDLRISALGTYFPDITSASGAHRNRAVGALLNSVRLAIDLKRAGYMTVPIIEMVCGTLLDRCDCGQCNRERIWQFREEEKINLLLRSLGEAVAVVEKHFPSEPFAFALELEPGDTYVLHDTKTLRLLTSGIHSVELLAAHVGLNVDIAHMHAASVAPAVLEEPEQYSLIAHAHTCDLPPRMHSRDQTVGRWSTVDLENSHHAEFLEILTRRCQLRTDYIMPFSGTVAVELEGCGRTEWVYGSVAKLRELLAR
jgi:sugar phosphate isomerase/epimerase